MVFDNVFNHFRLPFSLWKSLPSSASAAKVASSWTGKWFANAIRSPNATRLTWGTPPNHGVRAPGSTRTVRRVTRSTGIAVRRATMFPGGTTIITMIVVEEVAEASEALASRAHHRTRGHGLAELRADTTDFVSVLLGSIPACRDMLGSIVIRFAVRGRWSTIRSPLCEVV